MTFEQRGKTQTHVSGFRRTCIEPRLNVEIGRPRLFVRPEIRSGGGDPWVHAEANKQTNCGGGGGRPRFSGALVDDCLTDDAVSFVGLTRIR
jgi:hypothetical protein